MNNLITSANLQRYTYESAYYDRSEPNIKNLCKKLAETILLQPLVAIGAILYRTIKILTYVPLKAVAVLAFDGFAEAGNMIELECVKTAKTARNLFVIPLKIARVINDIRSPGTPFIDNNPSLKPEDYLKTDYNIAFQHFSSEHFSNKNFKIIIPNQIQELPAYNDPSLKAVMGSHFLKSGMMGIGFGSPNVFLFTTHDSDQDKGSICTVDAKSFKREDMKYKDSNGKLQSGLYFIPTNLPKKALEAIENAAKKLEGRRDKTCVNTNCRILKEAGFTMDGVDLEDCYLPTTFMEDVLFRNIYYKGQKIHFDIVKTTPLTLEEYFEKIDTAVLTTPLRHWKRRYDTNEDKQARSEEAKKLIAIEKERLKDLPPTLQDDETFKEYQIKVGISSSLGDLTARFWGRHTVYEINLSEKKDSIAELFDHSLLKAFPQKNAGFVSRLKRDLFFSKRSINFLRKHMIGSQNSVKMKSLDFLRLLKSSGGARLNYTLLHDRIIIARVNVATTKNELHRKAADWALSKHALLANREDVYCSGELWYDQKSNQFFLDNNSGTYYPDAPRVKKTVELANEIFQTNCFAVSTKDTN